MISFIKIKLKRHHFDAVNAALQVYIPVWVNSNKVDIQSLPVEDRNALSRRVLISLVDDMKYMLQKVSFREAGKSVTIKLSESEGIAMYFFLQNIPLSVSDQFTLLVVNDIIGQLYQYLVKPTAFTSNSKTLKIEYV